MRTALLEKSNPVEASARSLLKLVLGHLSHRAFVVQLWNGEQWGPRSKGVAVVKLIFRNPNVVRNLFSNPSALTFGEAYIHGDLDVQGSLLEVFESGDQMLAIDLPPAEKLWSPVALVDSSGDIFSRRHIFRVCRGSRRSRRKVASGSELPLRSSGRFLEGVAR